MFYATVDAFICIITKYDVISTTKWMKINEAEQGYTNCIKWGAFTVTM